MIFFAFLWSTSFLKKIIEGTAEITKSGELVAVFSRTQRFQNGYVGKICSLGRVNLRR